ncbi:spermatogenesis-associated protein 1 isoform X2 [Myripristis murdjan]|uniref:spermatogenesis-associated protein 1 isoform X2 n=1 Tax=Myripristis murdjan TaxID=586833 RepID=UPI001175E969|nr:spermatogenesis-associated protein 1 isoform X2 [Myripristis murdjan]
MDLSCDSMRYPEERRPTSSKFVELHVLYVPDDQWNIKLNKVPAEATDSFISAGFIRVYPDITLKTLRGELGILLGTERSLDKFSFLKCVGRSLALVKSKQENDLKVKTFAPPYAAQPELYVLPMAESDSSVCSQSLSPETCSSSPDHQTYYPPKTCSLPTGTKEPVKFPLIPQCSQQPPLTPSLDEEEEEEEEGEEDEEDSYSSTEAEGENEEEALSPHKPDWIEEQPCPWRPRNQRVPQPLSQTKAAAHVELCEVGSAQVKKFPVKGETGGKKKQCLRQRRAARDSGVAESVEDSDSLTQDRLRKAKDTQALTSIGNKPQTKVTEPPVVSSLPVQYTSSPPASDLALATHKTAASPAFQTNRDELIEEIKLVREERKQLEWTRQELLRKGKDLLAQNRHRRNQARDSWKKKYFETKKATAPLEDTLRNLRQELETFYNKLLHQLQARDSRGKPRRQGRSSTKNELIIQIMTESHEIDNLKRKVEDAKMKLVTEIKHQQLCKKKNVITSKERQREICIDLFKSFI